MGNLWAGREKKTRLPTWGTARAYLLENGNESQLCPSDGEEPISEDGVG